MDSQQLNEILEGINSFTSFSKTSFTEAEFDKEGFESRCKIYENRLFSGEKSSLEVAEEAGINLDLFQKEAHVFTALNPGKVLIKYISAYFKNALEKQKNIDAIIWMRDNIPDLTIDYICEKLNISEKDALNVVKQQRIRLSQVPQKLEDNRLTFLDVSRNEELQQKLINYFNRNPYTEIKNAIKDLNLNISLSAMRNGLELLINEGYKVPCFVDSDPFQDEKLMADVVAFKEKNMYATPKALAKQFNIKESQVLAILNAASEEYRQEKIRSYELYFKKTVEDIEEIGDLCLERFHASPNSSSRWLEIRQMGIEKLIRMMGMNAPAEVQINQNVNIMSKEDKDALIKAFYATDVIDVTPIKTTTGT
jgi:hypothetical protein